MNGTTRREFLRAAMGLAGSTLLARSLAWGASSAPGKLNFVFILLDDMGWMDLGCFGSRFYQTPNIDNLAAQGMRFTQAYAACPVCSPTRASIQTGRYPARLKLTNFIAGNRAGKLRPAEYVKQMPLEELTLGEAFKEAGYSTCFVGKWHLGGPEYYPDKQGYDANAGVAGGMKRFSPYNSPFLKDGPKGEYITDRLTDEAVKFLDDARGKPFLLFLSHYAVHVPIEAKADMVEKYKAKADKLPAPAGARFLPEGKTQARQVQDHPAYAAMIQSVDEGVGRVMKKIEDLGIADQTAIIFMSDNGGLSTAEGSPTSNVPLRGGKGWLYEGGIREPMIVKWPGAVKAGSVCEEPVTSTDFYPTMLEMAGLPLRPKQHVDGVSILPLLKQAGKGDRQAIYWHYPHYSNQGGGPGGAVRAGDYKLIEFYEDGRVELYNLKDDPGEKQELSAKLPEKAAELRKMLQDWRKSVDANMPTPNPDYKPDQPTSKLASAEAD
jgi:arylsulfatase A-like enzyme